MSEVMMSVLQIQNESLTRQVAQLGLEIDRVRKLLTEFDLRHDRDQDEIRRLGDAIEHMHPGFSVDEAVALFGGEKPDHRVICAITGRDLGPAD